MKDFSRILKSGLLAWIPIIVTIGIWIAFRTKIIAQHFHNLPPDWLSNASTVLIVICWFIAWVLISLTLSLICSGFYYWWTQKHRWKALYFGLVLSALGASISLLAFLTDVEILTLSIGEIMIASLGYACFLPWFAQKELHEYY